MSDTAFAVAFAEAGYRDPLDALAHEAWRKWSSADAGGARRDFVKARLCRDLTWSLVAQWQPQSLTLAIGWLLHRAKSEIEAERPERDAGRKPANGGGHLAFDTHGPAAPANPSRDAGQPAGDGQLLRDSLTPAAVTTSSPDHAEPRAERGSESANLASPPKKAPPTAPNLTILADKHAAAMAARARVEVRLSRLDTVKIDGRPIGDCTVAEVRAWAAIRETDWRAAARDVRFALSLIGANLGSNEIVRKWVKPDEADEIYDRAEAEHAA